MTCKIATEQASQICKEKTPMQNCDEKISCKIATKLLIANLRGKTKPSQIFARKSVSPQICNSYCCLANLQGIYFCRKFASVLRVIFIYDERFTRERGCSQNLCNKRFATELRCIFPLQLTVFSCSDTVKPLSIISLPLYFSSGDLKPISSK